MSKSLGSDGGRAARAVRQRLESLKQAGVTHLPKAKRANTVQKADDAVQKPDAVLRPAPPTPKAPQKPVPVAAAATPTPIVKTAAAASAQLVALAANVMPPKQRPAALEVIRQEVAGCVRCPVLVANRTQTVFGVGNPSAKIVFFGEAPGADEDRQGEPFVGRAGQLLTKMIEACGLKREEIYIMNVLKCRPPDNRNPLPDEVTNCRGYFERQFDIIRPEMVCCLGAVASQALLQTDRTIGKLRKQFHDYRGITVVCTYHPAYLLRNPAAKGDTWEDLKMMMRKLGVEL